MWRTFWSKTKNHDFGFIFDFGYMVVRQERRIKYLTLWKLDCGNFITGYFPVISTVIEEFQRYSKIRFKTLPKKLGTFRKGYEINPEYLEEFEYCVRLGQAPHFIVKQNSFEEIINEDYYICFSESKNAIKAFGEFNGEAIVDMNEDSQKASRMLGWY